MIQDELNALLIPLLSQASTKYTDLFLYLIGTY